MLLDPVCVYTIDSSYVKRHYTPCFKKNKRNFAITVRRRLRLRYQIDPPNGWNIRRGYRQFVDRGCVCKGMHPGRSRVSDTLCNFFLWGFVKDKVYLPSLPQKLEEYGRYLITDAILLVSGRGHIEHL
ncbi:hypothetical protein C0J52_07556 [Blattella germanica]|nr:hypothetical protein C0J52_07556 [Blattella germanica]